MVRPRKPDVERRSRTICVRVTTAEAAEIAERAGAGRLTKGAYIRRRALGQPVREVAVHRGGRSPSRRQGAGRAPPDRRESQPDRPGPELRSVGAGRDAGGFER